MTDASRYFIAQPDERERRGEVLAKFVAYDVTQVPEGGWFFLNV
jgi:hypothetical protein